MDGRKVHGNIKTQNIITAFTVYGHTRQFTLWHPSSDKVLSCVAVSAHAGVPGRVGAYKITASSQRIRTSSYWITSPLQLE